MDYSELIALLNKKGFHAAFFKDVDSAKQYVLKLIEPDTSVGMGGSVSILKSGLFNDVVATGKQVFSAMLEKDKERPDLKRCYHDAMNADVYLTSTNALTLQGDLINIDGRGNRVAAMFYGPEKVIVFCGTNKITKGPHDAIARIKKEACPKNAQRLKLDTPCATGKCTECDSPQRMCNVTVRMQYPTREKEIHIVLVDEALGY